MFSEKPKFVMSRESKITEILNYRFSVIFYQHNRFTGLSKTGIGFPSYEESSNLTEKNIEIDEKLSENKELVIVMLLTPISGEIWLFGCDSNYIEEY